MVTIVGLSDVLGERHTEMPIDKQHAILILDLKVHPTAKLMTKNVVKRTDKHDALLRDTLKDERTEKAKD